jgi:hypothetical protein
MHGYFSRKEMEAESMVSRNFILVVSWLPPFHVYVRYNMLLRWDRNQRTSALLLLPLTRSSSTVLVNTLHAMNEIYCSKCTSSSNFFFSLALQPPLGPGLLLFQFHDHFTDGRTPWTSDQLVARPLPKHRTTQTQNKRRHTHQTSMPCVRFETTIPASERTKTVHASDRSATVTGSSVFALQY